MDKARLNEIWPKVGGILSIIILAITAIWWFSQDDPHILVLLFWSHLAILMIHEFEEYVYPGGFKEFFNTKTVFALPEPQDNAPLNDSMITYINLGSWALFFIAALLAEAAPWVGVMMIFSNIVNVIGHVGIFQIKAPGYNPGLASSIFVLLPFIVAVFLLIGDQLSGFEYAIAIIGGVLLAAALPITGNVSRRRALQALNVA